MTNIVYTQDVGVPNAQTPP